MKNYNLKKIMWYGLYYYRLKSKLILIYYIVWIVDLKFYFKIGFLVSNLGIIFGN